ncbi:CLUMA_CG011961, isoform A [Clunio marinus]|uniref:Peroxisomal biogenesis factor 3 n=1 Tax=Clunio marinus TaxID=568069 RepID=A0A1J1IKM2_9DIPT|nr:CLUMA_CG011961, isoform A [Clunio marinus]
MFSRLRNFVSRNRRKFIVGGIVVAGTSLAVRYAQQRLREYQEKQVREFLEKTRRLQHFESTEKTTDQAILGLMPGLCDAITKLLDTDAILAELRTNTERKLDLWEELKYLAFAKCTTFVYATALLVASLRVQLNIIGGYLYKDTVQSEAKITKEVQTIYNLLLIQHLMNDGLQQLVKVISSNVEKIMKSHSLKEKMTLSDVEQIFWSIQTAIEKDINKNLVQFILPSEVHRNQQDEFLNKMLSDTLDVLECGDFIDLCESCFNNGFSVVTDKVADFFVEPQNGKNKLNGNTEAVPSTSKATSENMLLANGHVNINNISLPLAKLIPIMNALTTQTFTNNSADNIKPNNLAASLISLQIINTNIKTLAANVYEVYSN